MLNNHALADDVCRYCERIRFNSMFIVLGRDYPWDIESKPPKPGPNVDDLFQPLAFLRVEELVPVYESEDGDIKAGATRYERLPNYSRSRIFEKSAFKVFASTTVKHERLNFPSFREAALVKVETVSPGIGLNENRIFTAQQILGYNLEVYKTFPPTDVVPPVEQKIGMIRPF